MPVTTKDDDVFKQKILLSKIPVALLAVMFMPLLQNEGTQVVFVIVMLDVYVDVWLPHVNVIFAIFDELAAIAEQLLITQFAFVPAVNVITRGLTVLLF